ncbi:MAG: DHH family phosphoesterase [Candidatus Micrarchaeota archaeon]
MKKFLERCEEVRERVERMRAPRVVGHYDCDGLASTSIVARALKKMGKKYAITTLRKLSERELGSLAKEKEIVFVDFGAARAGEIEKLRADCVIIDHHQTSDSSILQANPHIFGIDGGTELSASGTAYFVFRECEEGLVDLAVVGAVGDMQVPLQKANREILREGEEAGRVKSAVDIKLFGRITRPLVQFLTYATEPFLPGLTGNEEACAAFLGELKIELKENERWRAYYDLGAGEKKNLVNGLVDYLYSRGAKEAARELVGEVYLLLKQPERTELSDASEFSTLLNACGRHDRPEVGIGVCMGEEGAFEEAKQLLALHRSALREGIKFALENVEDFGKFYFLDGRGVIDDGIIGVVAGMLYGNIKMDKPVFAAALDENGQIKISTRATKKLVKEGLNLGALLREATAGIGEGGGHAIAAGATVKKEKLGELLRRASELLG